MDRDKLIQLLNWKLTSENKMMRYRFMQKSKEEIYESCYEVDCKITMFELLKEMSDQMTVKQLQYCLQIPSLLNFLYDEWLKVSDSRNEELESSLWIFIKQIEEKAA